MRSNKNSLKQSIIQVRNTLILQDIEEDLKNKKSKNSNFNKNYTVKKTKEDKMLRNAYKNVINVITNILDNIEDEKANGKITALGTHRLTENKTKVKNKRPIKKIISYDIPKINCSLDLPKTMVFNTVESIKNNNTLNVNKSPFKLSLNWKNKKSIINENSCYTEGSISELSSSSLNSGRQNKTKIIHKRFKKDSNQFFKPRNKLMHRWNSSKNTMINSSRDKIIKNPIINKSFIDNNSHSLSSCSLKNSTILKSKKILNNSVLDKSSSNQLNISSFNITNPLEERKETKNKNTEPLSPFSHIQPKIQITDTDDNTSQNFFEMNNSEINSEIYNPISEQLINTKKRSKLKRMLSPVKVNKIINLKPLRGNLAKTLHKEKKYRSLLSKGFVYDSLDDEEESDEEEIYNCYFEPHSIFLYILDSLTLISSFIIIFYLPIHLAKRLFFCHYLMNIDTIIFYFIDFIYIFDLIINFYRSYYNFEENLIKKNLFIFLHYLKTWLLFDLISSIPIYTILIILEDKCINKNIYNDSKLVNTGKHSYHYNVNLNNMKYILLLIKVIKTLKIFKKNIVLIKIRRYFNEIFYINNWADVLIYLLFFISLLNFTACIFIFLGRNVFESWIFLNDLEEKSFLDIYIAAIYYLVMTVTTVGYGDVIGRSLAEVIFQIIMVFAGTCIYSWIISSVSNYVKKMNERNTKYEEKVQVLEEIKLNSHINKKLYNKIIRLLNYRKFHEEENEKNIILESLPNTLKNTLLIEMYKTYINDFSFFKGIENREFIVQIISKLSPIIGIKGDILIQEGEFIEEIIFIKNGVLSLEVWIDMSLPEESVQNYLIENGFINSKERSLFKSSSKHSKNSTISPYSKNNVGINTTFNQFFEKIDKKNEKALNENKKKLKVLDIRKNEHFGDVYMFLNKKSPLYVRVSSRAVDLLFLKKLDALSISDRYPDVWKNVMKKPIENSKIISNLTLKTLSIFCNINGIKTKLFRKKKKNKNFPKYYLRPSINKKRYNSFKRKNNIKNGLNRENNDENLNFTKKSESFSLQNLYEKKIKQLNGSDGNENSAFTFYNSNNNSRSNNKCSNIFENRSKVKSSFNKSEKEGYKIFVSKYEDKEQTKISKSNNNSYQNNITGKNFDIQKVDDTINNKEENIENIDMAVNDEILPEEKFNIQLYEDEKPKGKLNVLQKIIPDNIYINNLNINYLGMALEKKENVPEKAEKKKFDILSICSISTVNINSSYENIDDITSHKYITNYELRAETKNFLIEKCKIFNSKIEKSAQIYKNKNFFSKFLNFKNFSRNVSKNISKNSKIYNSSINNNIKHLQTKNNLDNNGVIRKTVTNDFKNKLSYETLSNFHNLINKSENNVNKKLLKTYSSNSLLSGGLLKSRDEKSFDTLNEIDFNDIRKRKTSNARIKKKQKLKELDIISTNIQKSSQNLNQPDLFYAGLFNNLINKDYLQLKETHKIFNTKDTNFYIEDNNEIKEMAKESELQE